MMRGRKTKEKNQSNERNGQAPARAATRTTRYEVLPPSGDIEPGDIDELDEAATGWRQTTAKMAGLTKITTVAVWALLLSGPAIGLFAVAASGSSAPARTAKTTANSTSPSATGPAGFAELYLAAYISAGEGTEETLAPYYAEPVTLANRPGSRTATHTVTVAAQQVSGGYWAVTVAAHIVAKDENGKSADQGLHYFRIGVQVAGTPEAGGTAKPAKSSQAQALYAATSLPAEVNPPVPADPGKLNYGSESGVTEGDPVGDTVTRFVSAYLTGQGELNRYVSPGLQVSPIVPAPYTSTLVTGMQDDQEDTDSESDDSVPADGTRRHVLATVSASSGGEDYTLSYALTLTTRDGRWEVAAFDSAPALSPDQTGPTSDTSATPRAAPSPDPTAPTASAGD